MTLSKSFAMLAAGTVGGVLLVLACSDDSPMSADAATCDCPAAEPPLAGRIVTVAVTATIAAGVAGGPVAICERDSTPLGGGCVTDGTSTRDIVLIEAGFTLNQPFVWTCKVNNLSTEPVAITAKAHCLLPAP